VYQMVEPGGAHMAADGRGAQLAWPIYCVPAGTPAVGEQSQRVLRPRHAAPEALSGRGTVELAVDIYGLGEILFWLLAGRPAFDQPHIAECAHEKEKGPPDLRAIAPDVTRPTAGLVARMLSPDPSRRPAAASAVAAEIRRIAGRLDGGESSEP
jgi:eukaryotic-like serine/threonine-protein kinase